MKNELKKLLPYAMVGVISGATVFGGIKFSERNNANTQDYSYFTKANDTKFAGMNMSGLGEDFTKAAKMTVPAVVTIKNYSNRSAGRSSEQPTAAFSRS